MNLSRIPVYLPGTPLTASESLKDYSKISAYGQKYSCNLFIASPSELQEDELPCPP